jgi:hypothetical protein
LLFILNPSLLSETLANFASLYGAPCTHLTLKNVVLYDLGTTEMWYWVRAFALCCDCCMQIWHAQQMQGEDGAAATGVGWRENRRHARSTKSPAARQRRRAAAWRASAVADASAAAAGSVGRRRGMRQRQVGMIYDVAAVGQLRGT